MRINFQQNCVGRSVKTVHTNLFAKKLENCINLQLAIKIGHLLDMHYPLMNIQTNFEINCLVRYQITAKKKKLFPKTVDGPTDGQTSRTTTIGIFFSKINLN